MGKIVFENDPPYKRLDAQSAEATPTSDGVELALKPSHGPQNTYRRKSRGEPCWHGRLARFRTIQVVGMTASALRRRKACRGRDHTAGDAAMA